MPKLNYEPYFTELAMEENDVVFDDEGYRELGEMIETMTLAGQKLVDNRLENYDDEEAEKLDFCQPYERDPVDREEEIHAKLQQRRKEILQKQENEEAKTAHEVFQQVHQERQEEADGVQRPQVGTDNKTAQKT